jgi:hypothetical protein
MSEAVGIVLGAAIASVFSVITVWMNNRMTNRTLTHTAERETEKELLEFKTQQLNELYGPLLLLLDQSKRLHDRLVQEVNTRPTGAEEKKDLEANNWRLLDHMTECMADEKSLRARIVQEIVDIGTKMEQLLITKGGLIHGKEPKKSFNDYLLHYRMLVMSHTRKENIAKKQEDYFPRQFPTDVRSAYDAIQAEREALISKHSKAPSSK